jgi:hypothetical protein
MAKVKYDVLGSGKTRRLVFFNEKRRLVCSCGNSSVVYGASSSLMGLGRRAECWDCGEARRKAEEAARAAKVTRLMHDQDET